MIDLGLTRRASAIAIAAGVAAGMLAVPAKGLAQEKPAASDSEEDVNDPLEPMNRAIFSFNMALDKAILRPIAIGYRAVLPAPARESAANFLDNLESPVILLNDLLQGKPARAGKTVARFGINTVIGFLGFFDPAEAMGIERHDEDFAQTMGTWGVSSGPYLVLPFLGPLPPRDTLGFAVDIFSDPLTYLLWDHRAAAISYYSVDVVDRRHQVIDELDELEKSSVDYYAAIRSLYSQHMNSNIRDGKTDVENLPDFGD